LSVNVALGVKFINCTPV